MNSQANDDSCVRLGPSQTINTCRVLADQFRDSLQPGRTVVVDAAEFADGDITVVQILLAARRSATAIGCDIVIADPSPAFAALLRRSGVAAV